MVVNLKHSRQKDPPIFIRRLNRLRRRRSREWMGVGYGADQTRYKSDAAARSLFALAARARGVPSGSVMLLPKIMIADYAL